MVVYSVKYLGILPLDVKSKDLFSSNGKF